MTTNRDWLFSLPLEEQYAWMNAEHQDSTLDGDTEPENEDSRERLEAEIESYSAFDMMDTITLDMVIGWLDRQAAITEREVEHDLMKSGRMAVEVERERIKKLTAERDDLKEYSEYYKLQYELASEDADRLTAERERYRSKFGKCLDYADAIHALMDDEGMA